MPLDVGAGAGGVAGGLVTAAARNALFVGREPDLKALARALKAGGTAAVGQIAAVTGLGGIGKTQLACEFVYRYGQYFAGGVFWLSFADPAAIPAEIATCGGAGGSTCTPTSPACRWTSRSRWSRPSGRARCRGCWSSTTARTRRCSSAGCRVRAAAGCW